MPQIHEIKVRIKSIKDTMQTTRAMKLISAAKLKKARKLLIQTLPYFDKVEETIYDILKHSGSIVDNIYFDLRNQKKSKNKLFLIVSGDKGLAGGYNHNINKLAEEKLKNNENSMLLVVGQVGRNYFIKKKYNVNSDFIYTAQDPTVWKAREISEFIIEMFAKGEIDEVEVVYTKMISSMSLEPMMMQLLPLELNAIMDDMGIKEEIPIKIDERLLYEPSKNDVLDILVRKYVKGIVYGVLVEAFTSEQNSRMLAMDNATSNAEEMLDKLHLYYNRARQAAITQEISEIVGGAEALK